MKNVLLEHRIHFGGDRIDQLVYVYKEEDSNIQELKKQFAKNGLFLTSIPDDLETILIPGR